MNGDTFFDGVANFTGIGGHVFLLAAIEDGDRVGPEPLRDACRVDGGVSAADYDDLLADGNVPVDMESLQEVETVDDALELFALDAVRLENCVPVAI